MDNSTPSPAYIGTGFLAKAMMEYIEGVLEECASYMPILTYTVLQSPYFDGLRNDVDMFLALHPEYEVADAPKMIDLVADLVWIVVLVQYKQDEAI